MAPTGTTCDSCGRDGEVTTAVHRTYVTPESWDTPGSSRTLDEVEHWCFACLTHYPHQVIGPAGTDHPGADDPDDAGP